MFTQRYFAQLGGESLTPCKVDYEKLLKRNRELVLKVRQDIAAFEQMDSYDIDRTLPITLLGAMYARLHQLLSEEESILEDIDSEAAES